MAKPPAAAIDSRPEWRAHVDATADVPVATNDDLRWADGLAFGTPPPGSATSVRTQTVPRQHGSAVDGR